MDTRQTVHGLFGTVRSHDQDMSLIFVLLPFGTHRINLIGNFRKFTEIHFKMSYILCETVFLLVSCHYILYS